MKILVTGAGGFIGSHLTDLLLGEGHDVLAMVRYNGRNDWGWIERVLADRFPDTARSQSTELGVRFDAPALPGTLEVLPGDIQDPHFVQRAVRGCDRVFHLAALIAIPHSYRAPSSYVATNVQGTVNVLEACRLHAVEKLIHTSTSETYGTARYTPIDEAHPLQGQSPYAASKIAADAMALSYSRSFDLPVAVVRPFNTYGPRQSARAVIPAIMVQIAGGLDVVKLGALDPVRDLTYVTDTARGFMAVAAADECVGEVTNIGTGRGITIGELADTIVALSGRTVKIETDAHRMRPANSEVMELICSAEKAQAKTGWKPEVSLKAGLQRTMDFLRGHLNVYKPDVYNR